MRAQRSRLMAGPALLLWPAAPLPIARSVGDAPITQSTTGRSLDGPRQRTLFDFDWRFRTGEVSGGQLAGLDDSAWKAGDLPHDFMVLGKGTRETAADGRAPNQRMLRLPTEPEGPFDPRSPGGDANGYLNGGIGWYRKSFTLPAGTANRRAFLEFDGAYMNAEVWINGQSLGVRRYCYSSFQDTIP